MNVARHYQMIGKHTCHHILEGRLSGLLPQRPGRLHFTTANRAASPEVDVLIVGGGHAGQHQPAVFFVPQQYPQDPAVHEHFGS